MAADPPGNEGRPQAHLGPSFFVPTSRGLCTCLPDPQTDGPTVVTSGQLLSGHSDGSLATTSPPAVGATAVGNSGFSSPSNAFNRASAGASEGATGSGGGGGWVATHSQQGPSLWAAAAGGSRGGGGGGGEGGGGTRWYAVQDKACGTVTHMAPEAMVKGELVKGELCSGGIASGCCCACRTPDVLPSERLGMRAFCFPPGAGVDVKRRCCLRTQAAASMLRWTYSPSASSCEFVLVAARSC